MRERPCVSSISAAKRGHQNRQGGGDMSRQVPEAILRHRWIPHHDGDRVQRYNPRMGSWRISLGVVLYLLLLATIAGAKLAMH